MGGNYPGGGITLGPAMTFGWIAAHHLAGREAPSRRRGRGQARALRPDARDARPHRRRHGAAASRDGRAPALRLRGRAARLRPGRHLRRQPALARLLPARAAGRPAALGHGGATARRRPVRGQVLRPVLPALRLRLPAPARAGAGRRAPRQPPTRAASSACSSSALLHAVLLFVGDILVTYALLGALLWTVRDWPDARLLALARLSWRSRRPPSPCSPGATRESTTRRAAAADAEAARRAYAGGVRRGPRAAHPGPAGRRRGGAAVQLAARLRRLLRGPGGGTARPARRSRAPRGTRCRP